MTYQIFTHTRSTQPKNHIKKYIKQAAMLSVSLAAFCSAGNCASWGLCCGSIDDVIDPRLTRASLSEHVDKQSLAIESSGIQDSVHKNIHGATDMVDFSIGILNLQIEELDAIKALAIESNADTIGGSQRAMLNEKYQARLNNIDRLAHTELNGIALFAGGSGDSSRLANKDATGVGAETTNINTAFTLTGFVTGSVDSVNVDSSGGHSGLVNVVVGGQSFQGIVALGTVGTAQLTSVTDHANTLTLDITGTGLNTTADIQSELKTLFQLDIGSPISMRSASTDLSTTLTSVATGAATTPGIYGLSYGYNSTVETVTYKISNGLNVWEKLYSAFLTTNAELDLNARTVVFDNGFTATTAANTDERNPATGVEIINVEIGNQVTMTFQVGAAADDIIDIEFRPATMASLNLTGTTISEKSTAANTADTIDIAIIQVSNMIAKLDGTKAQFDCAEKAYKLQNRYANKR